MVRFGAAAIALVAVFGCARAPESVVFDHPTAQPGQFERDRYECLQQSQQPQITGAANAYRASQSGQMITNQALLVACMEARGWRRSSAPGNKATAVTVTTN